ncbi:MAG: division/cell wall cluster transcriptional repressor MraZ [Patescibacteria group bacterium]|jgi:MraZ protein
MLIGKFYHNLEGNGRISLPKRFRNISKSWIVTRGLDGCLFLLQKENFQNELNKITKLGFSKKANRDLVRLMTNEAKELTPDKNGRINLPDYLIDFAQLKKSLVIVGSLNRLEIWDQERYHQYLDQLESKAEDIAEQAYVTE